MAKNCHATSFRGITIGEIDSLINLLLLYSNSPELDALTKHERKQVSKLIYATSHFIKESLVFAEFHADVYALLHQKGRMSAVRFLYHHLGMHALPHENPIFTLASHTVSRIWQCHFGLHYEDYVQPSVVFSTPLSSDRFWSLLSKHLDSRFSEIQRGELLSYCSQKVAADGIKLAIERLCSNPPTNDDSFSL